ncbi:MAG TPA: response regulator [Thermoanaerobaculaceae bacterium]|nr:MAG: hypothetical protein B7Z61_00450 [Acidobacteria bacterium 37-71-11]HQT93463.1 response regulator [Thermoanaerobaculaceae bacterium]HQU33076.1 response regulator [Thermoanaerobaculaceae bacterium]
MTDARRVLVVSGDADLVRSLQILLEDEAGVGVIPAGPGETAIATLERDQTVVLALLDLDQPPAAFPSLLPEVPVARMTVPVLVMTAYPSPDRLQRARELGALACLAKPIDPEELLAQVRQALAGSGQDVGPAGGLREGG